jgi:hypothetical protein
MNVGKTERRAVVAEMVHPRPYVMGERHQDGVLADLTLTHPLSPTVASLYWAVR